ncbi:hypothetical protein [Catenulispora sp. EB89]|uniref:hypothetical protein n=1 Tax=Catenulispora sp. EB89 TaxID=3156257 RepID=UPI003519AC6E
MESEIGEPVAERWIETGPACEPTPVAPEPGKAAAERWDWPEDAPVDSAALAGELDAERWIEPALGIWPEDAPVDSAALVGELDTERWIEPALGIAVRWDWPEDAPVDSAALLAEVDAER